MAKASSEKRLSLLFYILITYVLLQFVWWAYLLIDLNRLHYASEGDSTVNLKIWMVIGEGSVFLIFLLTGVYIMQRTIKKEIHLVRQQRNFLLSITHELKTPIAAIKLGIQTLQKRKELRPEQRQLMEQSALNNTERLHTLIDNVLLATRIESGQHPLSFVPTNVSELTTRICDETATSLGAKERLSLNIADQIRAPLDAGAYESILVNLIENALKYSDEGKIEVSLNTEINTILLHVEDSGAGIPKKERKKVFGKFYRMGNEETRTKKGTGLGLFIVKELVELHQGNIAVSDSAKLGGAHFSISLSMKR